jgi:hypothetical protein
VRIVSHLVHRFFEYFLNELLLLLLLLFLLFMTSTAVPGSFHADPCHPVSRFNEKAFAGALPKDLQVTWNVHLKTTAGLTHYKRTLLAGHNTPR